MDAHIICRSTMFIIYLMSRIFIKITLLLALVLLSSQQLYKKIIHNTEAKAKCLDGSAPAVYFHQGNEKTKFLIYFVGGGFCQGSSLSEVLESCYQRSKTVLGTSKLLAQTLEGQGYLSTDPMKSRFAEWTKVIINYCDGSLHQGFTESSYRYKDAELFFRGADIVRSHLKWLTLNYGFPSAEKVLLTGSSAGGVATYLWSNYVKSLLITPQALSAVVDSGVFMNMPSPQSGIQKLDVEMEMLFKVANVNEKTPVPVCNRFKAGEQYKCLFLEVVWTSLEPRILLVNSQYDSWSIHNTLDVACLADGKSGKTLSGCSSSELANIQVYRKSYLNFLNLFGMVSKNSIWSISCANHVYTPLTNFYDVDSQRVPESTGETVRTAVERFVIEGERVASVDQKAWPGNSACAY